MTSQNKQPLNFLTWNTFNLTLNAMKHLEYIEMSDLEHFSIWPWTHWNIRPWIHWNIWPWIHWNLECFETFDLKYIDTFDHLTLNTLKHLNLNCLKLLILNAMKHLILITLKHLTLNRYENKRDKPQAVERYFSWERHKISRVWTVNSYWLSTLKSILPFWVRLAWQRRWRIIIKG